MAGTTNGASRGERPGNTFARRNTKTFVGLTFSGNGIKDSAICLGCVAMTAYPSHTGDFRPVAPQPDPADALRQTLEQARQIENLNRRLERYLSYQLQQLELAIASLEREQAHWNRQYRQELESLEQRKAELVTARDGRPSLGGPPQRNSQDQCHQPSAAGTRTPLSVPRESTGSGPLKIWLQPNGAGLQWLGALLLEIAKLNCAAGGAGVRFEMTGCRLPSAGGRSADDPLHAIYELEAFSQSPLTGAYGDSPILRETLAAWERYKGAMMLGGFDDAELRRRYEKGHDLGREHSGWETVAEAINRVDDAIVRYLKAEPNAWDRRTPTNRNEPERAFERQLQRLQATRQVMAEECDTRSHVALV